MNFKNNYDKILLTSMRVVLGTIFVWFGSLKMLGYNPVYDLIYNSMAPFFASGTGLVVLGALEVFIGLMLLSNRAVIFTHIILVLHLLGTFSTFLFGWNIIFDPYFPILSLDGEFVIKNIVLVLAGLMVLEFERKKIRL